MARSRRFVTFTLDMAAQIERLKVVFPMISEAQLRAEACRRGMLEMLQTAPGPRLVPTLMAAEQLRRVG